MTPPTLNLRYRIFTALARLDVRRPWLVIALSLTLAAACVFYTKSRLQFNTGQDDLISANNRDSRNYLRYTKEFPDLDGLIVVVKVDGNPVRAERFADTLARRLTADHVNVKNVFYRIDARQMGNSALLFLSDADLTKLRVHIKANLPMLQAYGANPTLATLFGIVNAQLDHATSSITSGDANGAAATPGMDLKLLDSILIGMNAASAAVTPSPWNSLNPIGQQSGVMGDGYLASDNGKYLLMQIAMAVEGVGVGRAARAVARFVRAEFRQLAGVFVIVFALVIAATVASALAWSGVGLIAFVPLVGLAVFPLQLAALLLRGLVFQYLGLTALGAYITLYAGYQLRQSLFARGGHDAGIGHPEDGRARPASAGPDFVRSGVPGA